MRDRNGFTIIEILVTISLISIVSVLIVTSFVFTYGRVVVEQQRTDIIRQSQLFLRRMVEDVRVSSEIRTNNLIADSYNTSGWTTSDPANILIATVPALDVNKDLLYDSETGNIIYHEVVYFGQNGNLYRRLLKNPTATASTEVSTCPAGETGCVNDTILIEGNLENMVFEFYDIIDEVTMVTEEARSIQMTINVVKTVFGQDIRESNTTRVTLRNE